MSDEEITVAALGMPLCDRITLAETLWESIETERVDQNESKARKALQRHQESSPEARGLPSIQEAVQAARRITGCA